VLHFKHPSARNICQKKEAKYEVKNLQSAYVAFELQYFHSNITSHSILLIMYIVLHSLNYVQMKENIKRRNYWVGTKVCNATNFKIQAAVISLKVNKI